MTLPQFESLVSWNHFCDYLISDNRYILSPEWQRFVDALLSSAAGKKSIIKKDETYYRARIGIREESVEDERELIREPLIAIGAPPSEKTVDGRANPRGISYLYMANDVETAIAETRPWLFTDLSVGQFKIIANQTVIDLTQCNLDLFQLAIQLNSADGIPYLQKIEQYIWASIHHSFSTPIQVNDEKLLNYIPTQYLAEVFKNNGYDGIKYTSSLNPNGFNLCLFSPFAAKRAKIDMYRIKKINYASEISGISLIFDEQNKKWLRDNTKVLRK